MSRKDRAGLFIVGKKMFPKAPLSCFRSYLLNWDPTGPREGSVSPRVRQRDPKGPMDETSARTR